MEAAQASTMMSLHMTAATFGDQSGHAISVNLQIVQVVHVRFDLQDQRPCLVAWGI